MCGWAGEFQASGAGRGKTLWEGKEKGKTTAHVLFSLSWCCDWAAGERVEEELLEAAGDDMLLFCQRRGVFLARDKRAREQEGRKKRSKVRTGPRGGKIGDVGEAFGKAGESQQQ